MRLPTTHAHVVSHNLISFFSVVVGFVENISNFYDIVRECILSPYNRTRGLKRGNTAGQRDRTIIIDGYSEAKSNVAMGTS